MRIQFARLAVLAAALVAAPSLASAQFRDEYRNYRDQYRNDQRNDGYGRRRFDDVDQGGGRNVAGQFDYYALVLSWSPTYCADANGDDLQCNRRDGRRFNFVLHGLWPQYERGYPADCRTPRRPFVPQSTIDEMLDIMPSPRLVIHEYRKHGTCSGLPAELYFSTSRRLFQSIKIPEAYKNPQEQQMIDPRQIEQDFIRANPGLKTGQFAIACGGAGNRLKEIRFCFDKNGAPRSCGSNEDPRRLCPANRVFVPPVRSTVRDDPMSERRPAAPKANPLPGPRDDYSRGI